MPALVAGIQHALVKRSIDRINRKQWIAPTSGCLAMGEGARGERDFSFQVSPRLFQRTCTNVSSGRARPAARAAVHSDSRFRLSESPWLRSLLYFPVFLQKTPRAAARAGARQKIRRGMPPGLMV
jgi:hypothetical protein